MTKPRNLTGLFLGAGASYEAGMPLVWELTDELKRWLTPDKFRWLNESWRSQGGGYPAQVVNDFVAVLSRPDQHYESLLGYLETQFRRRRRSPASEQYDHLYSWLVETVYYLLYFRHVKSIDYIQRRLTYYSGLSVLADQNKPLWIFSLNHDLIIECLAIRLGLPLNSGFTNEVVTLPRRDQQGTIIGYLNAAVLPGDQLESSAMPFFQRGTCGINLLKIHGALDVFTFRDGKDLVKILPLSDRPDGPLQALCATNEELLFRSQFRPQSPVKVLNEIVYADQTGEAQCLRRSLLAGAFKFDPGNSQVLPRPLLKHFGSYLNNVQSLACIGYGFGDSHINAVMREWLEFSEDRQMVIVDPCRTSVPETFLHVAPQIELHSDNTTDYLDSCAGIIRPEDEKIDKRLAAWARSIWGMEQREEAMADLQTFVSEYQRKNFFKWMHTLPFRDGTIDMDSLGISVDELFQEAKRQSATDQEILEAFLKIQDDVSPK